MFFEDNIGDYKKDADSAISYDLINLLSGKLHFFILKTSFLNFVFNLVSQTEPLKRSSLK